MSKHYNVAVVGATGAVGEVMVELLHERHFPVAKLSAVASSRSAGSRLTFGTRSIVVETLEGFDFSDVDIALFSNDAYVMFTFEIRDGNFIIVSAMAMDMPKTEPVIKDAANDKGE